MTAHQQTKLNELASMYRSTRVREDPDKTESVFVECYDVSTPEWCVQCGGVPDGHPGPPPNYRSDHYFKVAAPVATFRISPSGFKQRIDKVAA